MDKTQSPSLGGLILTMGALIVALVYIFVAFNTEDPLWFYTKFDEQPVEIFLNCYGNEVLIVPGDPQYGGLVALVNKTLSGRKNWDSLTMSNATYQEYLTSPDMMVMELYYSPQVRIHSFYRYFSNLDSLVIPLVGRHAQTNAVFGRSNNQNTAGSLHYNGIPDIRAYIENEGICTTP